MDEDLFARLVDDPASLSADELAAADAALAADLGLRRRLHDHRWLGERLARISDPHRADLVGRVRTAISSAGSARFIRRVTAASQLRPRRSWWPLALAAGLLIAVGLALLTVGDQADRLLVASGRVALERAGERREISADTRLSVGDALTAITAATLEFSDGTRLELSPQARLLVDGIAPKRFRFERGVLDATVAGQPAGAPLAIRTPQAVAEVLGTTFRLESGTASVLDVHSGQVRMSAAAGGGAVVVEAGQRAIALSETGTPVLEAAAQRVVATAAMHADWYPDGAVGSAAQCSFAADHGWRGGEVVRLDHRCSAQAPWANLYFDPHACRDWRGFDALALWVRGPGSGATVMVEVVGSGGQRFIHRFPDDRAGWRRINIPFADLIRRPDWQPEGAPETAFDPADIRGLNICLWAGDSGWFEVDEINLTNTR